jgi:general secretion pathway protein A
VEVAVIEEFWGLREKPFLNTPDSRFLFPSNDFSEALARLLYHIKEVRGGISLITGNIGCGKTYLSVQLQESLPDDRYHKARIINPKFSQTEFLRTILRKFGETRRFRTRYDNLLHLTDMLEENIDAGKDNVLIIDEAQLLSPSLIEEVRLLTNYEKPNRKYLQIVLLGQPEFAKRIRRIKQFNQRIQVRYFLEGMDREETRSYIIHRLTRAGAPQPEIFTEPAYSVIYKKSRGIPRVINNICENSLFIAYSMEQQSIGADLVREVAADLGIGARG